jgi:serine/threonine protein kinase
MRSNKKYKRWGENEYTKLNDCQHNNIVQVYAMVLTDKGNMAILMELAESDFVAFYESVIEEHKPPTFTDEDKEFVKEHIPES